MLSSSISDQNRNQKTFFGAYIICRKRLFVPNRIRPYLVRQTHSKLQTHSTKYAKFPPSKRSTPLFKNRVFNKLVDHQRFRVIYDSSQSPQSQGGTTTTAVVFLQTLALTRDFNFATFRQNAFLLLLYFLQKKSKNTQKTHSIIMGICIYILVKELYY